MPSAAQPLIFLPPPSMGEVPVRAEGALAKVAPTVAITSQPLAANAPPQPSAAHPCGKASH
jgi:hypothetical protein